MYRPVRQNGKVNMKKNPTFINILLTLLMGALCLVRVLIQTFSPTSALSTLSIPFLVAVSVTALVLEYYLVEKVERDIIFSTLIAGLTFTVLPMACGWNFRFPVWQLFIAGSMTFLITDVLYRSMGKRISSGPGGKLSPLVSGMILYLASHCFQGLL